MLVHNHFTLQGHLPRVEEGSYSRLIDFVCHSTLGLRVTKKKTPTCASVCDE